MNKKPLVYFAVNDLGPDDYRHDVIPCLRHHRWGDRNIVTHNCEFAGPYLPEDNPSHRRISAWLMRSPSYETVRTKNRTAMCASDLVVAYISTPDNEHLKAQLEAALSMGVPCVLLMAHGLKVHDLWLWRIPALTVIRHVFPDALHEALQRAIDFYTATQQWRSQ